MAATPPQFGPRMLDPFIKESPPTVPWLWEPWLPEGGLCLLTSWPKVGKSTLAYPLALAVARGEPFLGGRTKAGPVLLIAVEEPRVAVQQRFKLWGGTNEPIHVHHGPLRATDRLLKEIDAYIRLHRISLLVLDTLSKFWTLDDENDNVQVLRQVDPFLIIAQATGCTMLLLHHERKAGGVAGRAIRGGGALLGLADQALMYSYTRKGRRDNKRILESIGRYAETPARVVVQLHEKRWVIVGEDEAPSLAGGD